MIFVRSIVLLFLLACTICPAYAADKLRVAFPTLGPGSTPSWVTLEAGTWKRYDLDVELVLLSGGARMLPALVSDSVQLILGSDTGVTQANLQGVPITRLGVTMNSLAYSLVAPPSIRLYSRPQRENTGHQSRPRRELRALDQSAQRQRHQSQH